MTSRWISTFCLSPLALILVVLSSPTPLQANSFMSLPRTNSFEDCGPSLRCQDAVIRQGTSSKDRVDLRKDSQSIVVNVYRVSGVGSIQIRPPASGWPGAVSVRLHHFYILEGFGARSPAATFTCEQSRPDGIPARMECRLANVQIDAIKREPEYFEVSLPQMLLEGDSLVEINWVDQWR